MSAPDAKPALPLPPDRTTLAQRAIFCDWLRAMRGYRSAKDIAARAGIHVNRYWRIESGARTWLTPDLIIKLARGLEVDANKALAKAREAGY